MLPWRLTQRLEFRQSQSLVMTPQLMQAIKLLQLSNLDLTTFVEEELERNPLLERANDDRAAGAGEAAAETGRVQASQRWRRVQRSQAMPMTALAAAATAFEPGQEDG